MKITVSLEMRFQQSPDAQLWTASGFAYDFWKRYLEVFDGVHILARVENVDTVPSDWRQVTGDSMSFTALPYYVGPLQLLRQYARLKQILKQSIPEDHALILRVPSQIATLSLDPSSERPYGLEVVGDPYDVFAPGAVQHPLRAFFRWKFSRDLRQQAASAAAVTYVTAGALQKRYPAAKDAVSTHYSDVNLVNDAFVASPHRVDAPLSPAKLVFVGTLEQLYKAPDVLIDALALCVTRGLNLYLTFVGGGKHQTELEARARERKIGERIRFLGQLSSGAAVRRELDEADLFILPSHQEGLPRAMIEAMARGLPCIGSTAGGIPELLAAEDMVAAGDAVALAEKIIEVLGNPSRLTAMAARNLAVARDYHEEKLLARRIAFYRYIKERTQAWLTGRA